MKNRVRTLLLAITDECLDSACTSVRRSPKAARRALGELGEVLEYFAEPELAPHAERVSQAISAFDEGRGAAVDAVEAFADLREVIQAIEPTYTVVFLPYNASMWDSLHSIWQAAEADPRCEAIVVPIPYADLTPKRTVKEWHLHSDRLPPEVPVVDYREFDLHTVHPDVIYVHNPYDGYNRVTSVDPDYYSEALRPHCERLVYVPYFVGTVMEEGFYELPSFENFDVVVAQSEWLATGMIERWGKDKIAVLGSPKVDYVLAGDAASARRELPDDIAARIEGKTVILQITSLSTLLKERAAMVRKLVDVLDAIERREELVLWWRPHPLEVQTIMSMAPEIGPAYAELLERASSSPHVVLDTSSDLRRAMLVSDAYFGHWSSAVVLYGFTGKPIVIHDSMIATDFVRPYVVAPSQDPFLEHALPEYYVKGGALEHIAARLRASDNGVLPGQAEWFSALAANSDGTAGECIHQHLMASLR